MAESNRDEIAKLESMYAANPEGRVFTHLAEAYRKAGDLARAREVLEDGLQRHTDSASGYVVLGRVMQDMGQAQEATSAFARVLQLDPENRVALRALGELARASGDTDQAMAHFSQLLALDPSDESVDALLTELKSGGAPAAPPAAEPAAPASFEESFQAAEATPSSTPDETLTSAAPELLDIGGGGAPASDEGEPPPLDISSLAAAAEPEAPLDVTLPMQGSRELQLPPVEGGWTGVDAAEDAAAWPGSGGEQPAPVEGLETGEQEDAGEVTPLPMLEGTETTWLEHAGEADAGAEPALEPPPEWETAGPTEMVTETMAELYRAQGHTDRAVEVYRALLRDRPGDEQLERKLLELELAILSPEPAVSAPEAPAAEPVADVPAEVPAEFTEPQATDALAGPAPTEAAAAEEPLAEPAPEPEPWSAEAAPPEEAPWSEPAAEEAVAEAAVADAPAQEEPPEPWSEGTETVAEVGAFVSEAPDVAAQPEPEEPPELAAPVESEGAAAPPDLAAVPAMEAVWTSGGDVPSGEPSPYAWEAPEEEVGPPIADYLRGLAAWRSTSPPAAGYVPEPAATQPPLYEAPAEPTSYEPAAFQPTGYDQQAGYEASAGYAPEVAPWATEYPAEAAGPESAAPAEPKPEAPEWLEAEPPAEAAAEPESWSAPAAEPTWADEAAAAPWAGEEPAAEAPPAAGDMDWLTGPDGVAPEIAPPTPQGGAGEGQSGEGPTDDDDLEMFRAWLQSLKK